MVKQRTLATSGIMLVGLMILTEPASSVWGMSPFNVLAMAREIIDRCGLPDLPYGCYCGLGNHGTHKKPVDHLDSLCKVHDHCYDRALRELGCTKVEVYYLPSLWFVENGRIKCRWWQLPCLKYVCECDASLVNLAKDHIDRTGECYGYDPGCPADEFHGYWPWYNWWRYLMDMRRRRRHHHHPYYPHYHH